MSLSDPEVVRREFASERGLEGRRSLYDTRMRPDPREVMRKEIVAAARQRVLEIGQGPGELSERIQRELDLRGRRDRHLRADGRAPARARGVDARVGDVQSLPFPDGAFDLVVAAWMLFHVPDLDRGLEEIVRILEPGGQLVAVTNSEHHLEEARSHVGFSMVGRVSFSRENGEAALERHFKGVRRIDVDGSVTFGDTDAIREYLRWLVLATDEADEGPDLVEPLVATTRNTIFVAEKGR